MLYLLVLGYRRLVDFAPASAIARRVIARICVHVLVEASEILSVFFSLSPPFLALPLLLSFSCRLSLALCLLLAALVRPVRTR